MAHRPIPVFEDEGAISIIEIDYVFGSLLSDDDTLTILDMIACGKGVVHSTQVERKGPIPHEVESVLHFLKILWIEHLVLKSDPERVIIALKEAVAKRKLLPDGKTSSMVLREAPEGSHQTMGAVERSNDEFSGSSG